MPEGRRNAPTNSALPANSVRWGPAESSVVDEVIIDLMGRACGLTYADVAAAIGHKSAVRAVASACAANRVALLVPCHRVIRGDGEMGGYRWGVERKQALLAAERT